MDLLALKVTGHDVKRRIANQFSFVSLQQKSSVIVDTTLPL
jgi:hypothetical protein